ncbi:RNA-directed DNA polymerase, eukaryota [Tanacetum coccineum]
MSSFRSKENDVARISTTVYVTNFPDESSAKELFHACNVYGPRFVDDVIAQIKDKKMVQCYKDGTSFAKVVSGIGANAGVCVENYPALVLDDECLMTNQFSNSLFGRVKEFASLANIKLSLENEGFADICIKYLGEFWISLKFASPEACKKFRNNLWTENTFKRIASRWGVLISVDDEEESCFHSKRLCVHTSNSRSISEDFKIIFRGKVHWIRAKETPGWVPDFANAIGDDESDDDISNDNGDKNHSPNIFGDEEEVKDDQEHQFKEDPNEDDIVEEGEIKIAEEKSVDPFGIYTILNNNIKNTKGTGISSSYSHPPGFSHVKVQEDLQETNNINAQGKEDATGSINNNKGHDNQNYQHEACDSVSSGHFKKSEAPKTGGSILQLLDDVVKVGQVMGYKMDGCLGKKAKKEWVKDLCNKNKASGVKLMLVSVYAPHVSKEKHLLWDYLESEIKRWEGEVIIMGDFNEVRYKCERFGSVFNAFDANVFNSFIVDSGLVEVVLGGNKFTWCHKSGSKMSKLDRFLVSENLMNAYPNINAITMP